VTASASRNLHALAVRLEALPRSSMIAAAKAAKKIAADEGRAAGSPLKGNKRRGMTLRARDDIRPTGTGATMRIQGVNVAGWVWVNTGTAAHDIRRRKRGPRAKVKVRHPGTAGRGRWRRVQQRAAVVIPQIFRDDVHRAVTGRG
jgi:hypothetical protein